MPNPTRLALSRRLTRWTWATLIAFALVVTVGAQLPPTQVNNTAAQLAGKTLVTAEDAATVTGLWLFSRSTNPPFTVNANAGKVTNLDADFLDTQSGSYYLDLANATSILNGNQGGTGIANSGYAISLTGNLSVLGGAFTIRGPAALSLAANFSTAGANALTLTTTGASNVTLPTSGTLLTTGGSGASLVFGGGALSLGGNLTLSGASATTLGATGATSLTLPTAGTLLTTTGSIAGLTGTIASAVQDLITRLGTIGVSVTFSKALNTSVVALSDGATPALDASLGNTFTLTAAGNRTIAVPSNPTAGQKIVIAHTASGSDRTLALNSGAGGFRFGTDVTALTATTSGLTDYIGAIYNSSASKWDVVSYTKGF